ncbi:MAG TPA: hypothetical protein VGO60_10570, partial [Iamia sp.]|nr:hypothetical protein [Iamia sp.]
MIISTDHHRPTHPPVRRLVAAAVAVGLGLTLALVGGAPAQAVTTTAVTARVSVTSAGTEVKADADFESPALDSTGRFIAFAGVGAYESTDTNTTGDVYVRDRLAGMTTRVSVTDGEGQLAGTSALCGASSNLRYVG